MQFVAEWDECRHDSCKTSDFRRDALQQAYEKFGLADDTLDFIGYAVALQPNDDFSSQVCKPTNAERKVYLNSVMRHGGSSFS